MAKETVPHVDDETAKALKKQLGKVAKGRVFLAEATATKTAAKQALDADQQILEDMLNDALSGQTKLFPPGEDPNEPDKE